MATSMEVGIAAIAAFAIGFVWYGPLFGKKWCKAVGKKKGDCQPEPLPIVLSFFGWLAAASVFGWLLGLIPHSSPNFPFGLATVLWLSFILPPIISDVLWSGRHKRLIWIDGGYQLAGMLVMAAAFHFL